MCFYTIGREVVRTQARDTHKNWCLSRMKARIVPTAVIDNKFWNSMAAAAQQKNNNKKL